jgi:hypothetical protein
VLLSVVAVTADRAAALPCSPTTSDNCDPGGGGGGGGTNPFTQPSVYIADRGDTTLTVGWFVHESATYRLETLNGNTWSLLYSGSPGGPASFQHGPLARDSRHCYRLVARLGTLQKTSVAACGYTRDGLILRNAWRLQVRITTGDVAGGATGDDVRVGVFGPISGYSGGSMVLDHDIDDFERGQTHSYDLVNLTGIDSLGDIEGLEISKPGGDDWCMASVTLLINDAAVFSTGFGPPCQWVKGSDPVPVQIGHDQLHDYPLWGKWTPTSGPIAGYRIPLNTILSGNYATLVIGHDQLEGRIMSQVGDAMASTAAYWAPPDAVELTRWDSHRAKVDLDLKGEVTGTNPDIDVDFDMVVSTHKDNAGRWFVDVGVENAHADIQLSWWQSVLGVLTPGSDVSGPEGHIEHSLEAAASSVGIAAIWDVTASFDNSGNLVILATLQCPQPDPTRVNPACLAGNHL